MEISEKFGFKLPSRDADDIADINEISQNFRIIDETVPSNEDVEEKIENSAIELADEFTEEINKKVNVSDLYTEEEATPIAYGYSSSPLPNGELGIAYYLPNVKGGTSITAKTTLYTDYHFIEIYGANLIKPREFDGSVISGVTFTNREDGGIDIKGTATQSSMVRITEDCHIYGIPVLASGVGLYCFYGYDEDLAMDDWRKVTENGLEIDSGDFIDLQSTYMAFRILPNSSYDLTVYPMISLGFEKKEFEPYKEGVAGDFIYDENEIGTLEHSFDESGNYTIIESFRENSFECSNYTKVVDRFLPNEEKKNLATKEELTNEINEVKSYIDETFLGGSW